jgi:hypothetical protein
MSNQKQIVKVNFGKYFYSAQMNSTTVNILRTCLCKVVREQLEKGLFTLGIAGFGLLQYWYVFCIPVLKYLYYPSYFEFDC